MLRRFFVTFIGITFIGMGVALFATSDLGTDPYTSFVMAFGTIFKLNFAIIYWLISLIIFLFEIFLDRRLVGIGTIMNWGLVGVYVDLFSYIIEISIGLPHSLIKRVIFMLSGVVILGFGASLYQTANLGISPYDSLAIIYANKTKWRYFWVRIISDASCVLVAFLLAGSKSGLIGIGSLVCALGIGPVVHFFNIKVSQRLCGYE